MSSCNCGNSMSSEQSQDDGRRKVVKKVCPRCGMETKAKTCPKCSYEFRR